MKKTKENWRQREKKPKKEEGRKTKTKKEKRCKEKVSLVWFKVNKG